MKRTILALLCCTLAACATTGTAVSGSPGSFTESEKAAAARITAHEIEGHIRFLADDLLEGRFPGTRGDEVAVRYLASELEAMGLTGGAPGKDGKPSFIQSVPLVRYTSTTPDKVDFQAGDNKLSLTESGDDPEIVLRSFSDIDKVKLENAELVFVGYGIVAPEHGWDDYRGKDVKGKVVVVLNFNPPFAGEDVRLWYGRWDYKYATAAAHGAAGALIIHTTKSAGYPWTVVKNSNRGPGFSLPSEGEARPLFQGWITEDAGKRLFKLGGHDLEAEWKKAMDAQAKGAAGVALGVSMSLDMPVVHETVPSANVLGLLQGTDPSLRDELVIYTAHHDHLGKRESAPGVDGIYNGALDNASGCAAVLNIARAAAASPRKRSMLFLFVTAEEQGLLGSAWYARHPTVPAARIAADINIDSFNRLGRASDLQMLGLGKSTLDQVVKDVAAAQGRTVHGDAFPDRGSFYRSDQFELAKVGVPPVAILGGPSFIGRPPGWGKEQKEKYERENYHQPSDEYPPYPQSWDLSGAIEDAQLQLIVGLRVADAPDLPKWTPGDEFEKARTGAAK